MTLRLEPVQVATGSYDLDGHLVFADGLLAAMPVKLSEFHDDMAGMWFLEAGFGRVDIPNRPTFADLDEVQIWIEQQLVNAT